MMSADSDKPKISLDLIQLFTAVVKYGNISAAARAWNISPSLATRKIAALESALNAHLFDRGNRSIHLTEAGHITMAWATEVITGHAQLADSLAKTQNRMTGTLKVLSNEYLLTLILPEFLANFSKKFPDVSFNLTMTDASVVYEKADYDVMIFSGQVPDTSLKGTRIRDFQRVLAVSPEFLKRHGTPENIESLSEYDCLVHQQAINGCWAFKKGGHLLRQKIRVKAVCASHLPLIQLAKHGMGIIQISKGSIRSELTKGELVTFLGEYECVNDDGSNPSTWVIFPSKTIPTRTQVFVAELKMFLRSL